MLARRRQRPTTEEEEEEEKKKKNASASTTTTTRRNLPWELVLLLLLLLGCVVQITFNSTILFHIRRKQQTRYLFWPNHQYQKNQPPTYRLVPVAPIARKLTANNLQPDYAGLEQRSRRRRRIPEDDDEAYHAARIQLLRQMDRDARGSKDDKPELDHYHEQDFTKNKNQCYPPKWSYEYKPTCNHFHEFTLQGFDSTYLGEGGFRQAWLLSNNHHDEGGSSAAAVVKTYKFQRKDAFTRYAYRLTQTEAAIALQTSGFQRTMDVYGTCGVSTLMERGLPTGDSYLPTKSFNITQQVLDAEQREDVKPRNNLTADAKLDLALAMAESFAVLHGNPGGVIVYDDATPSQWLVGEDGQVKLNDFSHSFPLKWNVEKQHYCGFQHQFQLIWRSPEELLGEADMNESSDIVALGKLFYSILTGLLPYHQHVTKRHAMRAIMQGELPYLDDRYQSRSFVEGRLVEILHQMIPFQPAERVDIFQVVKFLRETKKLAPRM